MRTPRHPWRQGDLPSLLHLNQAIEDLDDESRVAARVAVIVHDTTNRLHSHVAEAYG